MTGVSADRCGCGSLRASLFDADEPVRERLAVPVALPVVNVVHVDSWRDAGAVEGRVEHGADGAAGVGVAQVGDLVHLVGDAVAEGAEDALVPVRAFGGE